MKLDIEMSDKYYSLDKKMQAKLKNLLLSCAYDKRNIQTNRDEIFKIIDWVVKDLIRERKQNVQQGARKTRSKNRKGARKTRSKNRKGARKTRSKNRKGARKTRSKNRK
jgi:hypothetical protein